MIKLVGFVLSGFIAGLDIWMIWIFHTGYLEWSCYVLWMISLLWIEFMWKSFRSYGDGAELSEMLRQRGVWACPQAQSKTWLCFFFFNCWSLHSLQATTWEKSFFRWSWLFRSPFSVLEASVYCSFQLCIFLPVSTLCYKRREAWSFTGCSEMGK